MSYRPLRLLLATLGLALVGLATAIPASAQLECTNADPCAFVVEVGPLGFVDQSSWNRSLGDVVTFEVDNSDVISHTVTLEGYGITLTVPAADSRQQTVALSQAGRFSLIDSPSQDTGTLTVVNGDSVEYESGTGTSKVPGLGMPSVVLAVALLAAFVRRAN